MAKIFEMGSGPAVYDLLVSYRSGDMWAHEWTDEALQLENPLLLDCVASGGTPFNDGRAGLRVVRMLEAATVTQARAERSSTDHRADLRTSSTKSSSGASCSGARASDRSNQSFILLRVDLNDGLGADPSSTREAAIEAL